MGATGLGPWWGYFQRLKMLNPLDTIKCTTVYSVKVCVCVCWCTGLLFWLNMENCAEPAGPAYDS